MNSAAPSEINKGIIFHSVLNDISSINCYLSVGLFFVEWKTTAKMFQNNRNPRIGVRMCTCRLVPSYGRAIFLQ